MHRRRHETRLGRGWAIRVSRADTEGASLSADAEWVFANRSECLLRFSRAGTLVGLCLAGSKAFHPLSCILLAPSDVGSQPVWAQPPCLAISLFRCFMCTIRATHNPQGGLHAARLCLGLLPSPISWTSICRTRVFSSNFFSVRCVKTPTLFTTMAPSAVILILSRWRHSCASWPWIPATLNRLVFHRFILHSPFHTFFWLYFILKCLYDWMKENYTCFSLNIFPMPFLDKPVIREALK